MTQGMTTLYGNPRPVGAGAVALLDVMLNTVDPPSVGPRPVPAGAVFGAGWPFQLAGPGQ